MRKIKIGIIGCGYWGPNLIRNFNSIDGADVSVCADLDESRLRHIKKLYPGLKTTKNYNEIIDNPEIEAVAIATPVSTHFKFAKEALLAGKHVLIEKPITKTRAECEELIGLSKEQRKVLMVDHTFEYTGAVNKMKEVIEKDELGKIFTIDMIRVTLGLFQKDINVIWDLAPHDISILIYLLKEMPKSVIAIGRDFIQRGIEDDAHLTLKFPDRVIANVHVSWLDPNKIRRTTIVGSEQMLVYDDIEREDKIKIYDKGVTIKKDGLPAPKHYDTYGEFQLLYRSGDEKIVPVDLTEPLKIMCSHFLDCIKEGKRPRSDAESGLRVVRVIEALQESLEVGSKEVFL